MWAIKKKEFEKDRKIGDVFHREKSIGKIFIGKNFIGKKRVSLFPYLGCDNVKSGEEIRERMRQRKRKAIIRKTLIKTGIILFLIMIVLIYCTWRTNKENEKI